MSVRARLLLLVVLVAIVPLAIATFTSLQIQARAQDRRLRELHARSAEYAARAAKLELDGVVSGMKVLATRTVPWGSLEPAERDGAVWLVFRHADEVSATSLLDATGSGIVTARLAPGTLDDPSLDAHPRIDVAGLEAFAASIPFEAALEAGEARGTAFTIAHDASPQLAIAYRVAGPEGKPWVVAIALSLRAVCEEVGRAGGGAREARLLDGGGRTLCGPGAEDDAPAYPALLALLRASADGTVLWTDPAGREWLAAAQELPGGWTGLVREPAEVAFATTREIRRRSLEWMVVALLAAIAAGLLLSRRIDRAVAALEHGARELQQGRFGHRIGPLGKDELGRLATTFDAMGVEIERRDAEIRRWNEELQARVEERTRELKEAQAQLVQSEKLAALSTMSAGMAHEINNPLAAALGLAQVLRMRSAKAGDTDTAQTLERIEAEAKRIRGIVLRLTSLAETRRKEGYELVDVAEVARAALDAHKAELDEAKVVTRLEADAGLPPVSARRGDLQQVLGELVANARVALSRTEGPRELTLAIATVDDKLVRLAVTDTGKGIAAEHLERLFEPFFTTKEEWSGKGLGLTVAYRIVQEHNGTLRASSPGPGRGSTFTLLLPAAKRVTHAGLNA